MILEDGAAFFLVFLKDLWIADEFVLGYCAGPQDWLFICHGLKQVQKVNYGVICYCRCYQFL